MKYLLNNEELYNEIKKRYQLDKENRPIKELSYSTIYTYMTSIIEYLLDDITKNIGSLKNYEAKISLIGFKPNYEIELSSKFDDVCKEYDICKDNLINYTLSKYIKSN